MQIDVTSGDGSHQAKYLLTVTRQERSYRLQQYQYVDDQAGHGRTWGELAKTAEAYESGKTAKHGGVSAKHQKQRVEIPVGDVRTHNGENKKQLRAREAMVDERLQGTQSTEFGAYKAYMIQKTMAQLHHQHMPHQEEDAVRYLSSTGVVKAAKGKLSTHGLETTGKAPLPTRFAARAP